MFKKALALVLAATMTLSLGACGKKDEAPKNNDQTEAKVEATGKNETLVIGVDSMNGIFSPFFYLTDPDYKVWMQVFSNICELNADNELVPASGEISFEELKGADDTDRQTKYTIKLKEGLTFSDGKPVTIDDVIFNYYVYLDPTYDGPFPLSAGLDIVGFKEYYYDSPDYSVSMKKFEEEANKLSDDELNAYVEKYTDGDMEAYGAEYINDALGLKKDATSATFEKDVREAYLQMNMKDKEALKGEAISAKLDELKAGYIKGNLEDGIDVPEIEGIKKVDDLTCTVLINGANISADRMLSDIPITPKHYYGVGADGKEFTKGDISMVKEKNSKPMGGGAFTFVSYDNNIATLKANPTFYKGAPKFPNLKFQYVAENNKFEAVSLGDVDVTDPAAEKETMEEIKSAGIGYSLLDYNGYGYIGLSAKRVTDKNVRKGLMHLMNRGPAIQSYFGDLAGVIERPMVPTLAEYPKDATEYYGYNPDKALEYFTKAGYSKDAQGKLVNKEGKQLSIECAVSQLATHPAAGILTQMKTDMDKLGAQFLISDIEFTVLSDRLQNDDLDMYVLAWGNSNDCDLTQLYDSSKVVKGGSNRVWLQDKKLDELMKKTLGTLDLEERRKLVAEELDIIMDWAVMMPTYQRKTLFIYNPDVINMDSIPENPTSYYNYLHAMHLIELN